jgi:hypothetical protein
VRVLWHVLVTYATHKMCIKACCHAGGLCSVVLMWCCGVVVVCRDVHVHIQKCMCVSIRTRSSAALNDCRAFVNLGLLTQPVFAFSFPDPLFTLVCVGVCVGVCGCVCVCVAPPPPATHTNTQTHKHTHNHHHRVNSLRPQGYVEDFGMRSTKIRLVKDGEIVCIPNSTIASAVVINGDDITKRRNQFDLWLSADTDNKVLAKFAEGVKEDLERHPGVVDAQAHYMDVCPIRGYRLEVSGARPSLGRDIASHHCARPGKKTTPVGKP